MDNQAGGKFHVLVTIIHDEENFLRWAHVTNDRIQRYLQIPTIVERRRLGLYHCFSQQLGETNISAFVMYEHLH